MQIGGETCTKLKQLETERQYSSVKPLVGRYVSSAGGILVALLEASDDAQAGGLRYQ